MILEWILLILNGLQMASFDPLPEVVNGLAESTGNGTGAGCEKGA